MLNGCSGRQIGQIIFNQMRYPTVRPHRIEVRGAAQDEPVLNGAARQRTRRHIPAIARLSGEKVGGFNRGIDGIMEPCRAVPEPDAPPVHQRAAAFNFGPSRQISKGKQTSPQ